MKRFSALLFGLAMLTAAFSGLRPAAEPEICAEAGFITIEPVSFHFHFGDPFSRLGLVSSEARMWYSFQPADNPGSAAPLFVFFNGGPGSATSTVLMSMGTGRLTLDPAMNTDPATIANPVSWTRLGHLLYIDARQTGFSYNISSENLEDSSNLFREFNAQNYNPFLDAGDFIRCLLRFLEGHPDLQANPVILVGESFGGIRATTMLHILLHPAGYGDGSEFFQDAALVEEILGHYRTVFPEFSNNDPSPAEITRQFRGQVLIQPTVTLEYQLEETEALLAMPGSPLDQIGRETGIFYDPLLHGDSFNYLYHIVKRDPFIYPQTVGWSSERILRAAHLLRRTPELTRLTGVDVTSIPEFYAGERTNAYRIYGDYTPLEPGSRAAGPAARLCLQPMPLGLTSDGREPGDVEAVFGELQPWDWYLIPSNPCVNLAFTTTNVARQRGYQVDFSLPLFGWMFLRNAIDIPTLITSAALDLTIFPPALPPALARHQDILSTVRVIPSKDGGSSDPDVLELVYRPGSFPGMPEPAARRIWFPRFSESGHMVSLSQPGELFKWVEAWLTDCVLKGAVR